MAQAKFPQRPVTLVVPTPPGGSTDFTARLIAEPLTRALGQSVIVDNKPGGSGNIGNQFVARAKPDGYTLLMAYSGYQVGNPHLFKDTGWDPLKDFVPVAMVTRAPQVFAIHHAIPVNSLQELIAYAKKNPGKLNYASSGNGSIQHIAGELLRQRTGANLVHVPYKGGGQALTDVLGGNIPLVYTAIAGAIPHVKSGKLLPIAVSSSKRATSMPDVATFIENGVTDFEASSWVGLLAPAKTPRAIVARLTAELTAILNDPEVKERLNGMGITATPGTAESFGAEISRDLAKYGPVVKAAGIKAE
jgi:tripartite-type tricarboxylate transporter receptor subunit TctC